MALGSLPATFRAVTMVLCGVPYTQLLLFARLHAVHKHASELGEVSSRDKPIRAQNPAPIIQFT